MFISFISNPQYFASSSQETKPVETKAKKPKEPTSFTMANPSRVVPAQMRFLSLSAEQRYRPVRNNAVLSGIVVLADDDPQSPEEVLKGTKKSAHFFNMN